MSTGAVKRTNTHLPQIPYKLSHLYASNWYTSKTSFCTTNLEKESGQKIRHIFVYVPTPFGISLILLFLILFNTRTQYQQPSVFFSHWLMTSLLLDDTCFSRLQYTEWSCSILNRGQSLWSLIVSQHQFLVIFNAHPTPVPYYLR